MKEDWKDNFKSKIEGKEKKMLSLMMAFLVIGFVINIILSFTTKTKTFEIKVKENETTIPFPILSNEMTIGGGISRIQELKKVEQELEIMLMQETLTRNDSLKLLYYYEYLKKNK